jgi:uncharacterized protein YktA (UPF0223 family)
MRIKVTATVVWFEDVKNWSPDEPLSIVEFVAMVTAAYDDGTCAVDELLTMQPVDSFKFEEISDVAN